MRSQGSWNSSSKHSTARSADLEQNGIRLHFIGDLQALQPDLVARMREVESRTAHCTRMMLNVAIGYGGRWDLVQAARRLAEQCVTGSLVAGRDRRDAHRAGAGAAHRT